MINGVQAAAPKVKCGFTLVELLIAITLLGLISTVTYGAIWTANRSLGLVELRVKQNDGLRVAQEFLRRGLVQARTVMAIQDGRMQVVFTGTKDNLSFVAPAPLQRGHGGGLYLYRLELVDSEDVRDALALRLRHSQFVAGRVVEAEPVAPGESILLDGVAELALSYYGRDEPAADADWMDEWPRTDTLPQLVRVTLTMAPGGESSTLTLAIKGQLG